MPVFGKSLFETVLDGMEPEEPEEDEDEVPFRQPRFVAPFLADTSIGERAEEWPTAGLYEDFSDPPPSEPEPEPALSPEPPEWLDRLADDDIAIDLGLSPGMTKAEIRARRRSFARSNHPDRVVEEFRPQATIRMTVANRLVEKALRSA